MSIFVNGIEQIVGLIEISCDKITFNFSEKKV